MVLAVVLLAVGVIGAVGARMAALWWARQPVGLVRFDDGVQLRLGARRVDASGHCANSGELAIAEGRLEITAGGETVLSLPAGHVDVEVRSAPRPSILVIGEDREMSVVVDRERPVPVAVGRIGRLRQATMARLVADALGEAAGTTTGG